MSRNIRRVLALLAVSGREVSEEERRFLDSWQAERADRILRTVLSAALVATALATIGALSLLPPALARVISVTHGGLLTLMIFWRLSLVRLRVDARSLFFTAQILAAAGYASALVLALREAPEAASYLAALFTALTIVNVMLCPFASVAVVTSAVAHLGLGLLVAFNAADGTRLPWLLVYAASTVVALGLGYARIYRMRREALTTLLAQRLARQNARLRRVAGEYDRKISTQIACAPAPACVVIEAESFRLEVLSAPASEGGREWAVARTIASGEVVALLVDVCGQGLAGAMTSHALRTLWDAVGDEEEFDAARFLVTANRVLHAQSDREARHAAAAVVVVAAGEARFYSAGFGPLLLVTEPDAAARERRPKAAGPRDVRQFVGRGRPLGLAPEIGVSPQVIALPAETSFSLLIGTESAMPPGSGANDRKVCALLHKLEQEGADALTESTRRDKAVVVVRRAA